MKKIIISVMFLMLLLVIYVWLSNYIKGSFDYHISEFIGYLVVWCATLFIISLFAFVLDEKKYRILMWVTAIYVGISILIAYQTGDGNGQIMSFDGESTTWILASLYTFVSIIYCLIHFIKNKKIESNKLLDNLN